MAGDEDYTPREIARALARLEAAIGELRTEVSTLSFVRQDVWSVERDAMHERIETVRIVAAAETADVAGKLAGTQENLRWLVRAVVGVVLAVLLGALLAAAGVRP